MSRTAVCTITTVLVLAALTAAALAGTGTAVGDTLPTITASDPDGNTVNITAAGKPMVLNFWRLGCPYCHEEMPDLMQFAADYRQTVDFYSIDVTDNGNDVRNYFNQYGFSFDNTVLLNGDMSVWRLFRSQGVPLTVVADRNGIVRHRVIGALTYAELENYVADADQY
ncbi:MAG: TlpA family protein disulfide reductase [Negativicutes bacterium]|nr:TlpA family protein disulfide reductase [Negativicutes bacterium]